jgi:hypothetical protein
VYALRASSQRCNFSYLKNAGKLKYKIFLSDAINIDVLFRVQIYIPFMSMLDNTMTP